MTRTNYLALLPTLVTLSSAACGFAAIVFASRVGSATDPAEAMLMLQIAGWLIFGGWFLDGIDGRIARLTNSVSRFGTELDSLADLVNCGVAPAIVLVQMGPSAERPVLHAAFFLAAVTYFLCTLLRLARFNVEAHDSTEKASYFKGLPCPVAAGCIAALAIWRYDLHAILASDRPEQYQPVGMLLLAGTFALSLLMVSTVRYPRVFSRLPRGKALIAPMLQLVGLLVTAIFLQELVIAVIFWGYVLIEPVIWALRVSFRYATALVGRT